MKVELRELEIELIAENEHERDALTRILKCGSLKIEYGRSSDQSWPPDPRKTNVKLVLPNPNDWGQ